MNSCRFQWLFLVQMYFNIQIETFLNTVEVLNLLKNKSIFFQSRNRRLQFRWPIVVRIGNFSRFWLVFTSTTVQFWTCWSEKSFFDLQFLGYSMYYNGNHIWGIALELFLETIVHKISVCYLPSSSLTCYWYYARNEMVTWMHISNIIF